MNRGIWDNTNLRRTAADVCHGLTDSRAKGRAEIHITKTTYGDGKASQPVE